MAIEVGFWDVSNDSVQKIDYTSIERESKLEDILSRDISIIDDNLLLIGRQVHTSSGKIIDLLAITETGKIIILELKRDRTHRDVVAQTLDYAAWVQNLTYNQIKDLYNEFNEESFEEAFERKFGAPPPEEINNDHEMMIICSYLDNETERIISYLSDNYSVPINAVFFRFFRSGESEFLSRSWLISPEEIEEKSGLASKMNKIEPWNGRDFVVNINTTEAGTSTWPDCVRYGFTSAGGGLWYSRSLSALQPGHRVFAMIPKKGYVGVGEVLEPYLPIGKFMVTDESGEQIPVIYAPLECEDIKQNPDDLEKCEYLVRVKWSIHIHEADAYWKKGLRANQNSAFKLRNKFTLDSLTDYFGIKE